MDKIQWWGYIHINGSLQAKRYFDRLDIQEANESPFAGQVFGPIEGTRDDIIKLMEARE